ncbi:hypothetical protein [Streptomyces sp. NPDC051569]|uniref:hypothetical protein n=1 Tax=Streptomyces sp. NPDC051569 TaxID=3365661 RepID=UPI00378B364C
MASADPEPTGGTGDTGHTGDTEGMSEAPATPRTPPPDAARKPDAKAVGTSVARRVPVLTLGAGITLIGLGLGFLGLRLRRR